MSKTTRPDSNSVSFEPFGEASMTCGFYNSIDATATGRRRYDAEQMSAIFDGVIADGVFATVGNAFRVEPTSGRTVTIDTGKAWLNHTWTRIDSKIPIVMPESDMLLGRYDAIVLEINASDDVKDNRIQIIEGTAASSPSKPTLTNNDLIHQHPICYIYRPADSTEITPSNIEYVVGSTAGIPWVTGLIDTVDPDDFLTQWKDSLDRFVDERQTEYDVWWDEMKQLMEDVANELDIWTTNQKAYILDWFEELKGILSSEDVATAIWTQVDHEEITRVLMSGFVDGTKAFSDDGLTSTSVDSNGRTLVKTFTSDFLTCTTVFSTADGVEIGRLVKTFSSDGKTISSEATINELERFLNVSAIVEWEDE